MIGTRRVAGLAMAAAICLLFANAAHAQAAAAGQEAPAGKPPYTIAEYNAEQACANDKVPASQVKCLDDFVSKYPNSQLLIYVYPLYIQSYSVQKNYPKIIENVDKYVALGDKVDALAKTQVLVARAQAFLALGPADQAAQAKGARDAAAAGLKLLDEVKKPETATDQAFQDWKKSTGTTFNNAAAQAATIQKDFAGAAAAYKAVLAYQPDDPIAYYLIGKSYGSMTPPQLLDSFWYYAKSITSKLANEKQRKQVTSYLRNQITAYQGGTVCDSLNDAEFNELLQLASTSGDRPESYKLLTAADLAAARSDMTIASVVTDLKAGGDKAKVTWFAACGLEFPDVPGKLIEVIPGAAESDPLTLKIAFVTNQAEFDAATTANMDVKIAGQPEAAKLEKDTAPRFTGTLETYDPDPAFMLHWDKAKVNADDLPKEKAPVKKPAPKRPAAKKPSS